MTAVKQLTVGIYYLQKMSQNFVRQDIKSSN
jgi:hypothetical protein